MDLLTLLFLFVAVVGTIVGIYYGYTVAARFVNNRAYAIQAGEFSQRTVCRSAFWNWLDRMGNVRN